MSFLSKLLGVVSGNNGLKISEQLLFDKVIGFRGIVPGVGTSTIVQNTAIALSETTNYAICVLDTHFLYPTQYPMLISTPDNDRKDFLEFSGDLSEVVLTTQYRNVHVVTMRNRTIVDMMSSKDNQLTIEKLMGSLKSFFDVILVDLSYELTHINTYTAIKCNKIINIADQSLKCVYNMRKSLNTMATLAVPLAKANKIVLNKVVPDVITNTRGVIEEAGLTVLGEIPFSLEIAKHGVAGKRIWASSTSNKDIFAFSEVINAIVEEIIQPTPLNTKYLNKNAVEGSKKGVIKETEKVSNVKDKDINELVDLGDSSDEIVFEDDEDDVINEIVDTK